jgi:hypothetical protein
MENLFIMVPRKASATLALTSTAAGGAQPAVNYTPDVKVTSITLAGATAAPTYTVNLTNVEDGLLFRIKLTNLQTSGTAAATSVTIVRGGSSIPFTANTHTAAFLAVPGGLQFAGELLDGAGVTNSTGTATGMIS